MDKLFQRFYEEDLFGVKPHLPQPVSPDDKRAIKILESTTRFLGDRYECGLLWQQDVPSLPNNRVIAEKRFAALERRFKTDTELAKKYLANINEYFKLCFARRLTPQEASDGPPGYCWWLRHHSVFNVNKPDKVRVVRCSHYLPRSLIEYGVTQRT